MTNELTDEQIIEAAGEFCCDVIGEQHAIRVGRQVIAKQDALRQAEQEPVALQQMAVVEGGVLCMSDEATLTNLIAWVDSRIEAEVAHRPDINVHKRTLSGTWNQVRRHLVSLKSEPVASEKPVQPFEQEPFETKDALRFADAIDPFTRKAAPDHLTSMCAAKVLRQLALYAAPQPAKVPDGYKLMPLEPTPEMLLAGKDAQNLACYQKPQPTGQEWAGVYYRAMLNASPTPQLTGATQ